VKSDKSLIVECNKGLHEEENDKNTMESTLKIHNNKYEHNGWKEKQVHLGQWWKEKGTTKKENLCT